MQNPDTTQTDTTLSEKVKEWNGFTLELFTAIDQAPSDWDRLIASRNILLCRDYLRALEQCPPGGMSFFYLLVRRDRETVGLMYMQLKLFRASESLNYERLEQSAEPEGQNGTMRSVKEWVASRIAFYTLLCGNSLVTGSHGFHFVPSIDEDTANHLVHEAITWARSYAGAQGKNVRLMFIKDFFTPRFSDLHEKIGCEPYHPFTAQPNMIMELPESWVSFDDYMKSLSSKYRVRVRRARKKSKGILMKDMDVDQIRREEQRMYILYQRIARRASFNLIILHPGYMASVKEHLGERFTVLGYYDAGTLMAFCSMMDNGDELEAHFLGYEAETNRARQLYLNMLLDMLVIAINRGIRRIVFSRTAMEIKSSVGAEPHYMYFYLQHASAWRNKWIPRVYHMLDPKVEWTPRSPFREMTGEG